MPRVAVLLVLLAASAVGCASGSSAAGLHVVATTAQAADLARAVGGSRVDVHQIVPAGRDPHEYDPRPSDARALSRAVLILRSGGEVDHWLGGLLDQAGKGARRITLLDAVGPEEGDPHWWQDPRRAERAVRAIRGALSRADPRGRAGYARRARSYLARLRRVDQGIAGCVRRVPPPRRRIVTSHDELGYFARRYGIEVTGTVIPARTSEAQPSARDLRRLVRRMRERRVPVVFPERGVDARLERAVAREAGARVGRTLLADTLGPGSPDGSAYIGALAYDADALVRGMSSDSLRCRP
ncbi:MAG: metal ABC transporter solute-binding protein, Zn/Mn family [Thermoleophilaceae bacterium]